MTFPASALKELWVMCDVCIEWWCFVIGQLLGGWGGGGERGNMKNTHCDFLEMWSAVLKDSMVSS